MPGAQREWKGRRVYGRAERRDVKSSGESSAVGIVGAFQQGVHQVVGPRLALVMVHDTDRRRHHESRAALPRRRGAGGAREATAPRVRRHRRPGARQRRCPVGIVSMRDLLNGNGHAEVTRPAFSMVSSTPIGEAARALAETDYHHLVVVDEATGRAVGMVSAVDLLRALLYMPPRPPPRSRRSAAARARTPEIAREPTASRRRISTIVSDYRSHSFNRLVTRMVRVRLRARGTTASPRASTTSTLVPPLSSRGAAP